MLSKQKHSKWVLQKILKVSISTKLKAAKNSIITWERRQENYHPKTADTPSQT